MYGILRMQYSLKNKAKEYFPSPCSKFIYLIISNYDFSTLYLKNKRAIAKIKSRLYFCIDNDRMLLYNNDNNYYFKTSVTQ